MEPYIRKVQYYETDMMGVAHHANFIHWMEEARIVFMDRLGSPYTAMEAKGRNIARRWPYSCRICMVSAEWCTASGPSR